MGGYAAWSCAPTLHCWLQLAVCQSVLAHSQPACTDTQHTVLLAAEFLHVKPGKGAAFVRTKLRNFITGNIVDKTFRGGESVEAATVERKETQFSYVDGDDVRPCALLPTTCHCFQTSLLCLASSPGT